MKLLRYFFITFILALSGCLNTNLTPEPLLPQVDRLISTNSRPINLTVNTTLSPTVLGHQYLFLILPFGKILTPHLNEHMANVAITNLALRGYRPNFIEVAHSQSQKGPTVSIAIDELSLTAYDFIFMRRIVSEITMTGQLHSGNSRPIRSDSAHVVQSRWVSFAFEKELANILRIATDQGMKELLDKLRL